MIVYWSNEALDRFDDIVEYLRLNFSEKEISKFAENTKSIVEMISRNPSIGKWSNKLQCNVFVLHRKISILYNVEQRRKRIRIITLWNKVGGKSLYY